MSSLSKGSCLKIHWLTSIAAGGGYSKILSQQTSDVFYKVNGR